jgi:hypothetical protein
MLKSLRKLGLVASVLSSLAFVPLAKADNVDNVYLTFASGATFTGTVDFSNDYSQVNGVNGILTGYQPGITGYQGSGSDPINWVWTPIDNYVSAGHGDVYANWLLDGPQPSGWSNFIGFEYDYTNAPTLTTANFPLIDSSLFEIDDSDTLTGGSINFAYSTTPEPGTMLLLGSGMVGLAGMLRRKIGLRA